MESSLRNTRDLTSRIDKLQSDCIRRFQNLVDLAASERKDRSVTAITQYQIQAETAALIRTAEDVQTLIRQLQEIWLFGRLNTLGSSTVQKQADQTAEAVADLLKQLVEKQSVSREDGEKTD